MGWKKDSNNYQVIIAFFLRFITGGESSPLKSAEKSSRKMKVNPIYEMNAKISLLTYSNIPDIQADQNDCGDKCHRSTSA